MGDIIMTGLEACRGNSIPSIKQVHCVAARVQSAVDWLNGLTSASIANGTSAGAAQLSPMITTLVPAAPGTETSSS